MPAHKPNPTKGVLLVMGAVFIFALSDTVTKHLATIYPVSIVLLMRYLVNVVLLLAILFPSQGAAFWRTKRTALNGAAQPQMETLPAKRPRRVLAASA